MLEKDAMILIVDDTRMVRETMKNLLKSIGFENLLEAENGREALKIINDNHIDLIFLDIVMPVMDGKETLKNIRKTNGHVPVVMLTSIADKDTIIECTNEGVHEYVLKPINTVNGPEILTKIIGRL